MPENDPAPVNTNIRRAPGTLPQKIIEPTAAKPSASSMAGPNSNKANPKHKLIKVYYGIR